ncbi:MAG: hypothetical protein ACERKD_16505 [Prolixibacteraceae bacterium]
MNTLETYGIVPISYNIVAESLPNYRSPHDRVSRLAQQGQLIRLKRGVFVVAPEISHQTLSMELIANHIYGPSYVSLESALRYYGLIPERVYVTRSITTKRARNFTTPLGEFEYLTMPANYYSVGIRQLVFEEEYSFLMATPEKAISDLIITTSGLRIQSARAMREYLSEDLRIDFDEHENWDLDILRACIENGRKRRELRFLLEVLQNG